MSDIFIIEGLSVDESLDVDSWRNKDYRAEKVKYVRNKLILSPDSIIKDWAREFKRIANG